MVKDILMGKNHEHRERLEYAGRFLLKCCSLFQALGQ